MAKRKPGAFQTSADGGAVWTPPPGFPPMADDDQPPAEPPTKPARDYAGRGGGQQVRPTLRPPSRPAFADGAGFALGLVLYAVGFAYLEEGPYGVRRWFSAKFINKVLPRKS